ncbi:MAG: GntR family transcriptional regulator [Clostridiales bacterium]|nr:GntR family transcriptional regulator [Clostridiales bacterium]
MQPKYQIIASELKANIQAGKYKNVNMLPTEHSLMDEYQVSRQTIRQALAVLEKEGHIEKRRGSGSYIRRAEVPETSSRLRTIAVVTTYISDYIFPSILREMENVLSRNNCMTLLFATRNQVSVERKVLQNLLDARIDGIIAEGTKTAFPNPNLDLYLKLQEKNIPIVFINGSYPQLQSAVSVLDDNEGGGQMLVEYLTAKGHKKIAGIFKSDDIQGHGRYAGYANGLQKCGISLDDSLIRWYNTELRDVFLSDAVIIPVLQRWKEEGCTAIVCYNDEMACQLIPFLTKCGLSVPEDISVVSFDNSHLCNIGSPGITSLKHPGPNVGSVAAGKLLTLMNGGSADSELLPWELVERASG